MVLETHVKQYVTEPDFLEEKILPPELGKWPETEFFELIEKFGH